jgi:hypothetical protein
MILLLLAFVSLGKLYRDMAKKPETRALLIVAAVIVLVGVVFYTRVEGWSVLDAVYFCVVTLGTVGYGDFTPKTDLGKFFTIIYIITGLGVISGFFASVGDLLAERGAMRRRNRRGDAEAPDQPPAADGDE